MGLSLRADAAGNLTATDASGAVVSTAAAPRMWDSPAGDVPRTERPVGVELTRDSLTLLPDRALLADEDARVKGVARIGHAPGWPNTYQDRSLFQFDITPVRGATVVKANFKIYQVWKNSHSCDPNAVDPMVLHRTGPIGPGTTRGVSARTSRMSPRRRWPSAVALSD